MPYLVVAVVLLFNLATAFAQTQEAWRARFSDPAMTPTWVIDMEVDPKGSCYLAVNGGVVKYSPSGAELWFRRLGDPGEIEIGPLALGNAGMTYVAAREAGSNVTFALSPPGDIVWTAYAERGGWGNPPRALEADSEGNVYFCGSRDGNMIIAKYTQQGALLWIRSYEHGFNMVTAEAMEIDASGDVCIAASSWFPERQAEVLTLKYGRNGDLLWSAKHPAGLYFPAPSYAIATDASNSVVVGTTSGHRSAYLLLKYSADGVPLWTNLYAGLAGSGILTDIAIDQQANVYATGQSAGHITTLKFGPDGRHHWTARDQAFVQPASSAPAEIIAHDDGYIYIGGHASTTQDVDFVVLKYSTRGTLLWSAPVHNGAYGTAHRCIAIEMDDTGSIYLTGQSSRSLNETEVFTVKLEQSDLAKWPAIITPPQPVTVIFGSGQVAAFSVAASSDSPLKFQWRHNGAVLVGATNSTYTIDNPAEQHEGEYSVIVSNDVGRVVSIEATLDVKLPPLVVEQPRDVTTTVDRAASFLVSVEGDSPLFFQWQFNGENIPDATNRWFWLVARMEHSGAYRVLVSNAFGVVVSAPVTLTVTPRTKLDLWTWRHPIPTNLVFPNFHAITEGKNRFITVGNGGTALLSFDGVVWTNVTTAVQHDLRGVAFGRNLFVLAGFGGTLMTSGDGFSWESQNVVTNDLYGLAFVNDRFVAVGENGTIISSTNGLNWFIATASTSKRLKSIAYGNDLYIAGGRDGVVLRSNDATNWIASVSGQGRYLKDISFADGVFAAVLPDVFMTSTNGIYWVGQLAFSGYPEIESVLQVEGDYVIAGEQGLLKLQSIEHGWSDPLVPTRDTIRDMIYTRGCVWAVGNDGLIMQSGQLRTHLRVAEVALNGASLAIRAEPGQTVRVEVSSDLREWRELVTVVGEEGFIFYRDNTVGQTRFYRLRD